MSKWQPINTAPKDRCILVYQPQTKPNYPEDEIIAIVQWLEDYDHYPSSTKYYTWCALYSWQDEQGGYFTVDHPTHWMPLPKPPRKAIT